MMWLEIAGAHPNKGLWPCKGHTSPASPPLMLKWSKLASLMFTTKVLTSDSQKGTFPPRHVRITTINSSSELPELFPLLLSNGHHFSSRPLHFSPNTAARPSLSPCLQSASTTPFSTLLPDWALWHVSWRHWMLLVTSQHHFAISFQTKPGFYSGIHNSLYHLV